MNDFSLETQELEADLWESADELRANSKLTSNDYFMPVLGVIFLRHAANRFEMAAKQIEEDQATGRMPKRRVKPEDYTRRRALWLPDNARYDTIMEMASTSREDLPRLVTEAMKAIEVSFEPLEGVLPKDFGIFEPQILEDIMRLFNSEQVKKATGDVFGRIYEYFLAKFSIQKAHDNGEFFTPASIVQTIVNVIEPNHGDVLDPACGSGGMFVQSSHFIEREGGDTSKQVVFYGQEKNPDTIRIAKMNLAVHGLEGNIADGNTFYADEHSLVGKCDFVMANPPFNVDKVDPERVKGDPRLPFGLPGISKDKRVSNANYLWISYFWSYLKEGGRAGFVMSSQASSAGHGEKEMRRKIVETGDVDVMISVRSNFFYARSVPCELWHFDRGKTAERKDKVLMLDARDVYRKVTRKINDFSPEQAKNLASIVWLHRGQRERFLALVEEYLARVCTEAAAVPATVADFDATLSEFINSTDNLSDPDASRELIDATRLYAVDRDRLTTNLQDFIDKYGRNVPADNETQHAARDAFDVNVEAIQGLVRQIDLIYKLAARVVDEAPVANDEPDSSSVRRRASKILKQLDESRKAAVEQLKRAAYFHRQIVWLQERFPKAELEAVPGLVKLVDLKDIEAADWSLTPGRYVGVAPPQEDEDFDFEQILTDIHTELADLDKEAAELSARIQENLEELGA